MSFKTPYSKPGPALTLFSEDGRALMHHPDPEVLRRSVLYVDDETTPILLKSKDEGKSEKENGESDPPPG